MSLVPLFGGVGISIFIVVDCSGRRSSQQFGQSLSHSLYSNIGQRISIIQSITLDGDRCSRSTVQICHKDSIVPGPVSSIGKDACYMGIAQKLLEYMRGRLRARQQGSAKSSAQFEYFRRSECLLVSGELACYGISPVGSELFPLVYAVCCSLAVKTWCRRV